MTVDGFSKCEKWIHGDMVDSKESKTTSWLRRFIGRAKKPEITWPFPFVEGRLFVLTLRAGVEGYHINVGGRHVTSFAYRTVCLLNYSNYTKFPQFYSLSPVEFSLWLAHGGASFCKTDFKVFGIWCF